MPVRGEHLVSSRLDVADGVMAPPARDGGRGSCQGALVVLRYQQVGRSIGIPTSLRRGTIHDHEHSCPVHPRPLAARAVLGQLGRSVHRGRVRRVRTGLARRPRHRRGGSRNTPTRSPTTASTTWSPTTRPSSTILPAKPILIGHSFGGMIAQRLLGEDLRRRSDRDRRGPDQGRAAAAAVRAQGHPAGLQEPGQQAPSRLADRRAVPLRLRQRDHRSRSRTSSSRSGRSLPPASRCSRPRPPTSTRTRRPRSTPTTRAADRCC